MDEKNFIVHPETVRENFTHSEKQTFGQREIADR